MPVASLAMYWRAETAPAYEQLWRNTRDAMAETSPDHLAGLPDTLLVPDDFLAHWRAPDLVLSQICGLPYRNHAADQVALVASPVHPLPGCPPGYYNSVFVMRADDPRTDPSDWPGLRFVCNEALSQSGWAAAQNWMHARSLAFQHVFLSGAHAISARAVALGHADIAAIDAQTWQMITRWDGDLGLREIARTEPTPGHAFITADPALAPSLRMAVDQAIAALSSHDRDVLNLTGLADIPRADYEAVPTPPFPHASAQKVTL
ncbi:MAG: PhnD/SsuA/transferrin family substrate-binding protein [Pseudomonadota bacterium]